MQITAGVPLIQIGALQLGEALVAVRKNQSDYFEMSRAFHTCEVVSTFLSQEKWEGKYGVVVDNLNGKSGSIMARGVERFRDLLLRDSRLSREFVPFLKPEPVLVGPKSVEIFDGAFLLSVDRLPPRLQRSLDFLAFHNEEAMRPHDSGIVVNATQVERIRDGVQALHEARLLKGLIQYCLAEGDLLETVQLHRWLILIRAISESINVNLLIADRKQLAIIEEARRTPIFTTEDRHPLSDAERSTIMEIDKCVHSIESPALTADVEYIRGCLLEKNKLYREALIAYKEAYKAFSPHTTEKLAGRLYLVIGAILEMYRRLDEPYEALVTSAKVEQLFPEDRYIIFVLARYHQQEGDLIRAQELYARVVQLDSSDDLAADACLYAVEIDVDLGKIDEAEDKLRSFICENPHAPKPHFYLAQILWREENKGRVVKEEEILAALKKALAASEQGINFFNGVVEYLLAYEEWLREKKRFDLSEQVAGALEEAGLLREAVIIQGQVHLEKDEFHEAIARYAEMLEHPTHNIEFLYYIAVAYYHHFQEEKAIFYFMELIKSVSEKYSVPIKSWQSGGDIGKFFQSNEEALIKLHKIFFPDGPDLQEFHQAINFSPDDPDLLMFDQAINFLAMIERIQSPGDTFRERLRRFRNKQ